MAALWRSRAASSKLLNLIRPSASKAFPNLSTAATDVADRQPYSMVLAANDMKVGTIIRNMDLRPDQSGKLSLRGGIMNDTVLDINSQIGSCMPLSAMRIGTMIHNIEMRPGQGGKLVRSAGTSAKILKEPTSRYVLVKMPSGTKKLIDTRCKATIGQVSNPSHGAKELRKAGHSRWLGRRPTVRGIAMNPVDHPHGGGEGKSKSGGSHGRGSRTPWGKPTKGGYKTGPLKRRK
uniref:50S ribosomal protein L2, chloroplastic n=1 Tax=Erodium texanum TaxID=28960 RepID=A0A0G2YJA8_EROTE|nr:ribosomal protein L2 [Erodium texanum]